MEMSKLAVEIKLVGVTFIPTYWEVNPESGEDVSNKRTVIGQLRYDCEFLPQELQNQLKDIIGQTYLQMKEES